MSFTSAPGSSGELSLETEERVAVRLDGGEAKPSSAMGEVRVVVASGDEGRVEAATRAADAAYVVEPIHDGHVAAFTEKKGADFDAALTASMDKTTQEYNNPEVVKARIERGYEALAKIAESDVSGLIDATGLRIDVLAGKSPTYLASDTLVNLARSLSTETPDTFEAVLSAEKAKYVIGIKDRFKQQGYNPRIIDILESVGSKEEKVKQLEQIQFSV